MMSKKEGGEYVISLPLGDVFFSFHHNEENCVGFFLKKVDLTSKVLDQVSSQVKTYFQGINDSEIEVKIIGSNASVKIIEDHFKNFLFSSYKKVEKENSVDVVFLPSLNKVRVSKDESSNLNILPVKNKNNIKVLIVDDSKTVCNILARIFSSDPSIEVCAMAYNPNEVEALILKHRPDVITLDLHMPEMDGITLLKLLVPKYNIPTILISSISKNEGPLVLEALENGAVDYIQKPEASEIDKVTPLILEKVKTAARANIVKGPTLKKYQVEQTKSSINLDSLILIGSSTGGTEAIRQILGGLPDQIPPILIVQHIPAVFSAAFAKRMNDLFEFEVKEAANGDEIKPNRVLIAPGGLQMKMVIKNGKSFVEINDDEPVNRFKPSVDYMFMSVAKNLFSHTVAVILTGMGKDGARGLLELKSLGVRTIAQDELTSVVYGMPKEAASLGAAEYVEPLSQIAERITILTKDRVAIKKIS